MAQKVVFKIPATADPKKKQKAIEVAAKFQGIDSISVDVKEQKMIIIGQMDIFVIAKMNKKILNVGEVDLVSFGPAKEKKKEKKKGDKKEEKEKLKKGEPKKEEKINIMRDQMRRLQLQM